MFVHSLFCLILVLLACNANAAEIYFPRPESADDTRNAYAVSLLRLALEKAGSAHVVRLTPVRMVPKRAIFELGRGTGRLDILSSMTSSEREADLLPIRIPISKGLIGWRIALLKPGNWHDFKRVNSLADLKGLRAGQGDDWPDVAILRRNGLTVLPGSGYDNLFGMLAAGRFDYFPRSIADIWAEAKEHAGLVIDPYVILRYPAADYFFVNRNNVQLAEEVRRGLEAALADGSFDQLFYAHHGKQIQQARLHGRRIIELVNHSMPPATPLSRKLLWVTIDDLRRRGLTGGGP